MSANLDLVRSIFTAWERGDFFSSGEWVDPEIEFVWADGPDPGSWTGSDEMGKAWSDQLRLYQEYRAIADDAAAKLSALFGAPDGEDGGNVIPLRSGEPGGILGDHREAAEA